MLGLWKWEYVTNALAFCRAMTLSKRQLLSVIYAESRVFQLLRCVWLTVCRYDEYHYAECHSNLTTQGY